MSSKKEVAVIGSGLVGGLLSIYLSRRGHKVNLYERRPDMRKQAGYSGRSINLALSDRGWRGLEGVGLSDAIKKVAIPMYKRVMHAIDGTLTEQAYGEQGQAIYSVSRGGLNCTLMDLAEQEENLTIHFDHRCTSVDLGQAAATFETYNKQLVKIKADHLFGADGAFSAARLQMQLSTDRFEYSQHYLEHGYKELSIPAANNGTWQLEKNALHIWPRGGYMLIALPNLDGSFTCTLFFPFNGEPSFSSLKSDQAILDFFKNIFPDAYALIPDLLSQYHQNPTGSLVTVKCFPWSYADKVCLIGDAAHAIVPFYGQGMNAGFEDCYILNQLMDQFNDWQQLFTQFETQRKPNADAIATLAYNNFIEMRDLVGDSQFLLQKKIESRFHKLHPDKWLPLYSQVTFSTTPYHQALYNGNQQQQIMNTIMAMPEIDKKWDSNEVELAILNALSKV